LFHTFPIFFLSPFSTAVNNGVSGIISGFLSSVFAACGCFTAGAANASTPYAGEVMGILCAATPGAVRSGMEAALSALEQVGFEEVQGVPYLAHTVSSTGSYLSGEAGVREGASVAYLIAPPLEAMYALDAALKAADVKLCKLYNPPSETNFGGALLSGTQSACTAACEAFAQAVKAVAETPIER
jgi:ethanolamine utilization protein EutL